MARLWIRLAVVGTVVCVLIPCTATAQTGGGLYEPFPEPAPEDVVRSFIRGLPGDRVPTPSSADLAQGRFVEPAPSASRPASERAAGAISPGLDRWLIGMLTLALFAGLPVAWLRRA